MNPEPMNKGYRRLFWGTFFLLVWGGGADADWPMLSEFIGLCACISGTGIICGTSDLRHFFLARRWAQAGLIVWALQLTAPLYFEALMSWSVRFVFYFLNAAVTVQLYVYVLVGAGKLLGGTWASHFAGRANVFAGIFTVSTVVTMCNDLIGGPGPSIWHVVLNIFLVSYLLLVLWTMYLMALLRRHYFPLTL